MTLSNVASQRSDSKIHQITPRDARPEQQQAEEQAHQKSHGGITGM